MLTHSRHYRVICTLPVCVCPHCCVPFTATYEDVRHGREMPCPECEQTIRIGHIELPEGSDDDGFSGDVTITLTTGET